MECIRYDKDKKVFAPEERGEHPLDASRKSSSRGIDTASRQLCLDTLMSAPSTEPKSMIKKLVKAGISLSNIPSTIQISNMKSNLQHDTSDESPHRLQTFPQPVDRIF